MDTAKHTTAVLTVKGDTALSILLAGIAAADEASTHYEQLGSEHKRADRFFPGNYYEGGAQEQYDLFWGLKEAISFLPASTLPEAAAQIGQALNAVEQAHEQFPEGTEIDAAFKSMKATLERLLHSAMRAVEHAGGFSLVSMGLSSLRNENRDPWAEIDGLVQKLKSEGVK